MDGWTLSILRQTTQHFTDHNWQAYLVAGSLRNILLSELCIEEDIVTDGNATAPAHASTDKQNGYYVHLHKEADCSAIKREE